MTLSTFDINDRYAQYTKKSPIFSYLGHLTCSELNKVLKSTEIILSTNSSSQRLKKKLFNLLIEITQNLSNHLNDADIAGNNAVFILLMKSDKTYKIITGNYLRSTEIAGIRARIEMVNALNNEELKALYRGVLDIGLPSTGGGAGLGLIDIARKSGENLYYNFEEIDESLSFFTLEVTLLNE